MHSNRKARAERTRRIEARRSMHRRAARNIGLERRLVEGQAIRASKLDCMDEDTGLTPYGRRIIDEMERVDMVALLHARRPSHGARGDRALGATDNFLTLEFVGGLSACSATFPMTL